MGRTVFRKKSLHGRKSGKIWTDSVHCNTYSTAEGTFNKIKQKNAEHSKVMLQTNDKFRNFKEIININFF